MEDLLARISAPAHSGLPLPRLLLVFAHPDDEVLAVGARLERMAASRLLTMTDGAPHDGGDARAHGFASLAEYREGRQAELQAVLQHAGLPMSFHVPFDRVPDQQAGLHLERLSLAVAKVLREIRPEAVVTHPYEGGHPDHDACAFVVHMAVKLAMADLAEAPLIVEAPFYRAGENGSMRTGSFLPSAAETLTVSVTLTEDEAANKQARLAMFVSQAETLAQFSTDEESFRIAPSYDFTEPPHAGRAMYEHFPWGMTAAEFCRRAASVLRVLGHARRVEVAEGAAS